MEPACTPGWGMRYTSGVLIALLALSLLMIVHEFGHYWCARRAGMYVDRFSVFGIGPVLFKLFERDGCEFVISAVPFGAYVHIVGMESEEHAPEDENGQPILAAPEGYKNFRDSSLPARIAAIIGGPAANYLAGMVLAVGLFAAYGISTVTGIEVSSFAENSPAQKAGLQKGDVFLKVAGEDISGKNASQRLVDTSSAHLGKTVDVMVQRDQEQLTLPVTLNQEAPALGVGLAPIVENESLPLSESIIRGVKWPFQTSARILGDLRDAITGKAKGEVSGPVGIVAVIADNSADTQRLVRIVAMISVALGLFNLLPLPALDGGRLLFLFIESVMRRPLNRRIEDMVHSFGMIALLLFIGYVTIGDVKRLVGSGSDDEDTVEQQDKGPEAEKASASPNE